MVENRPFGMQPSPFATSSSLGTRPLYTPPAGIGGSTGFQKASTLGNAFSIGTNAGGQNSSSILQNKSSPWESTKPVGSFSSIGSNPVGYSGATTGTGFGTSSPFYSGSTFNYSGATSQSNTVSGFPATSGTSGFASYGTSAFSTQPQQGTASLSFRSVRDTDSAEFSSFIAMPEYAGAGKSLEEIRAEDYALRKQGRIQFPRRADSFPYGRAQTGPNFAPAFPPTVKSTTVKPGTNVLTGAPSGIPRSEL